MFINHIFVHLINQVNNVTEGLKYEMLFPCSSFCSISIGAIDGTARLDHCCTESGLANTKCYGHKHMQTINLASVQVVCPYVGNYYL